MTIHLPEDLASSIRAQVNSGLFRSEEDLVTVAVRDYLSRHQAQPMQTAEPANDSDQHELQRRLFAAGIISEIKQPITDLTPYLNRQAVPIEGEPISETAIRERR